MPELPEVEVVRRGLEQVIQETPKLCAMEFLRQDLRFKIPIEALKKMNGGRIHSVSRRAKYLIFKTDKGNFISHLGMTGTWRLGRADEGPLGAHDHIRLTLSGIAPNDERKNVLIYRDPRRFGVFDLDRAAYFSKLGPEPLSPEFTSLDLIQKSRRRTLVLKSLIMNQEIVVGVGNIYASEVLFRAGIRPTLRAANLSHHQAQRLVESIQQVLTSAIEAGGSSISDFKTFYGNPGEYHLQHFVYDRAGQPCRKCHTLIKSKVIAGRSTFWCPHCQK